MGVGATELIVILAVLLIIGVIIPVWGWLIDDCLAQMPRGSRARTVWLVILIFGGPLGGAAYFLVVRRRRVARQTAAMAPEDR